MTDLYRRFIWISDRPLFVDYDLYGMIENYLSAAKRSFRISSTFGVGTTQWRASPWKAKSFRLMLR
jgi:hypothetical protein